MRHIERFFSKPVFKKEWFILSLWILLALLIALNKALHGPGSFGNYLLFKNVFLHTVAQTSLYGVIDNHYGPVFSLIIAPFALLPDMVGVILWCVTIALSLYLAIRQLPVTWGSKVGIYYICAHEMMTAASNMQTNSLVAALIIWSFIYTLKGKDFYATFFIALGLFIKLYGIAGLCFFFFSQHKVKYVASFLFWCAVLFVLPMLVSSPAFIIGSYQEWFHDLTVKNAKNIASGSLYQDISVMGMFRRILGHREWSNWIFLVPATVLFAVQYIRTDMFSDFRYRMGLLSSALLFVVLFSSGSESSTYIIAMCGVAIWFITQKTPKSTYSIILLVFAMLLTSFSPSDLFPAWLRNNYIIPYSLKSLPCFVIWLTLLYRMLFSCKSVDCQAEIRG